MRLALLLLLLVAVHGAQAHADPAQARARYKKGMAHFVLEKWDQAIAEFEAGFEEEPQAAFLYNIAQAHARAGRRPQAITYYRKYLEFGPSPADRADAERAISELEAAERAQRGSPLPTGGPDATTRPASPPEAITRAAPAPRPRRRWPIALGVSLGVIAAAGLAVGLGLGLSPPRYTVLPAERIP